MYFICNNGLHWGWLTSTLVECTVVLKFNILAHSDINILICNELTELLYVHCVFYKVEGYLDLILEHRNCKI